MKACEDQQEELALFERVLVLEMEAAANVVAERLRQLEWEEEQRAIEDWTND